MRLTDIKWTEDKNWGQVQKEVEKHYEQERKEFEEKIRMEQIKQNNEVIERVEKYKLEGVKQNQIIGSCLREQEGKANAHQEITDVFIKQHLRAKIVAARWMLGLGMAMTFLFKGQWMAWIVFIIMYILYANKAKSDALKAQKNRKDFGKRK